MKSVTKVSKENPKSTVATVIAAVIGVVSLFLDQATMLGISTEIVSWVSFGVSVLTFVMTYVNANLKA